MKKILILCDRRGWAFDTLSQALYRNLGHRFDIQIAYVIEDPPIHTFKFDLCFIPFWGETYHRYFIKDPKRVVKLVTSHRWHDPNYSLHTTTKEMISDHLSDAGTIAVMSERLFVELSPFLPVTRVINGFEPTLFFDEQRRSGSFCAGWAGNKNDKSKGLSDILIPAVEREFNFKIAGGRSKHGSMRRFYNDLDVFCIASQAEGEPLTLIEAMASGCFIVSVNVGIVPELVRHRESGLIVDRKVESFQAALQWCRLHLDHVRATGRANAIQLKQERQWSVVISSWERLFDEAFAKL